MNKISKLYLKILSMEEKNKIILVCPRCENVSADDKLWSAPTANEAWVLNCFGRHGLLGAIYGEIERKFKFCPDCYQLFTTYLSLKDFVTSKKISLPEPKNHYLKKVSALIRCPVCCQILINKKWQDLSLEDETLIANFNSSSRFTNLFTAIDTKPQICPSCESLSGLTTTEFLKDRKPNYEQFKSTRQWQRESNTKMSPG